MPPGSAGIADILAGTSRYRLLLASVDLVREPRRPASAWPYSERHVQCVWFDPRHRPHPLLGNDGEPVWVEDPGIWNQEAGPDFIGAVARVGSGRHSVRGDVEIHVHPSGWHRHQHQSDPRYRDVRFHVTWFSGTLAPDSLPPGTIQLCLGPELDADACFSLDAVDTTAYPYAARADAPPCATELRHWHPDQKESLLDAAGTERIRRKAERLRLRMDMVGTEQALYEDLMAALGYKHNKVAFRSLAGLAPLATVREQSGGDALTAYAILLGCSGLLPGQPAADWDPETRVFYHQVWTRWWKHRSEFDRRSGSAIGWRLAGVRPANHPRRRLMAAARLVTAPWSVTRTLTGMMHTLSTLRDPYWDTRLSLGGKRQDRTVSLLGQSRINAILINVLVPYHATRETPGQVANLLSRLPVEADNEVIRRTAHYLFGADHPRSLYRTGLRRQGLIQIFQDFCLNDRSRCQTCPLPGALREHRPPA